MSVAGCGDVNGDDVPDLLVGAPQWQPDHWPPCSEDARGYARLHSGRTGSVLYTFRDADSRYSFASVLGAVGDLNADGLSDLVIGSPWNDIGKGAVFAYAGNRLFLNAAPKDPKSGEVLTLTTREASSGWPVALFLVAVNGTPTASLVQAGYFGSDQSFVVAGTVTPELSGIVATFRSYATVYASDGTV